MAVAKENKIVRGNDLTYIGQKIKENFVKKDGSKVLSTNDYTTEEKTKLAGIESGAQKNVKPDWNAASGSAAEILNKPTIPAAVQPATVAPKMDGTAAVGSSEKYAKEDHVHPSDTNKLDVNNPVAVGKLTIESGTQAVVDGIPHPERKIEINYSRDSYDLLTYKIFNFSSGEYRSELTFKRNWFATGESPIELYIPCPDGNSGTLALTSDIPEDKVYVATYGVTRYASIKEAYDKKKVIVLYYPNAIAFEQYFSLAGESDNGFAFSALYGDFQEDYIVGSWATITADNTWKSGNISLASKNDIAKKANKSTSLAGYGITDAYTIAETNAAIANALKGGYTVVATLPTASADTVGKIYLVPMTDTEDDNVKEEYITYLDGSAYKWEKLGTTQFDNSDYEERLTAAEITTLLNL